MKRFYESFIVYPWKYTRAKPTIQVKSRPQVLASTYIFSGAKTPMRFNAFRRTILTDSVNASLASLSPLGSAPMTRNAL